MRELLFRRYLTLLTFLWLAVIQGHSAPKKFAPLDQSHLIQIEIASGLQQNSQPKGETKLPDFLDVTLLNICAWSLRLKESVLLAQHTPCKPSHRTLFPSGPSPPASS